jgi:hypothetical protein
LFCETDELIGHFSISRENGTTDLVGRSYDNDTATGDVTNERFIRVELSEGNSVGKFLTGTDE